jgi:dihydrodipicolinate synthase/N-acetylneuraminate lyase
MAAETGMPIILYNFPARTGVDMDAEFLEAIKDVKLICAMKESGGSIGRYYQHMMLFPNLQRICGFDDQALDHFLWGSRSWIAGASNFLPAEHVALYEACVLKQDDYHDAAHLSPGKWRQIYSVCEIWLRTRRYLCWRDASADGSTYPNRERQFPSAL